MKALITGAGGFIGKQLLTTWVESGHTARALFLPGEDAGVAEALGVEVVRGDLTRPETLHGIADDMDVVFHLAARVTDWGSRKAFERIMVDGTRHLLEASRGRIGRFVYFSSIAALGFGRDLVGLDEGSKRVYCGIPYCDTKIDAEDLVHRFCTDNGLAYTIIRPANVIGPESVWVSDIIDAFRRGPLPLVGGGDHPGAFIDVANLADGAVIAAQADAAVNRTYHFRDDYSLTWKGYLQTLGGWMGKRPVGNIPFWLAWRLGAISERLLTPLNIRPPMTRLAASVMGKNNDVANHRAKTELGWQSRVDEAACMDQIKQWVFDSYLPS